MSLPDVTRTPLARRSLIAAGATAAAVAVMGQSALQPAVAHTRPSLMPIAEWKIKFDQIWIEDNWNTFLMNRATSADSWLYYHLSYGVDGLIAMAEATGDRDYLDAALDLVEAMIATALPSTELADERFEDEFHGWTSANTGTVNQIVLYESVMWRYVARLLRVIHDTVAWYSDPGVRSRYDAILVFTEVHMFDKWWTRQFTHPQVPAEGTQIYRNRTHMASHWAFISLDLATLTADSQRSARCREIVDAINLDLPNFPSSLRGQMIPHPVDPEATFFSDRWGRLTSPGSDVSHGMHVISYLVESQERGDEWTKRDLCRLVRTFDRVLWPSEGWYAGYLDGSPGEVAVQRATEWAKLGRYSLPLQRRLEGGHEPSIPVTQGFHPMSYYGNCAKNAWLLGGGR